MVISGRALLAGLAWIASACSAFGPDDREHRYDLRLVSDEITTVDYEVEVFVDDNGRATKVIGLFQSDVFPAVRKHELNEVATQSPGFLGVKVEGVRIERLIVGPSGGTVTVELRRDGETVRQVQVTGPGARVDDLRAGKTF